MNKIRVRDRSGQAMIEFLVAMTVLTVFIAGFGYLARILVAGQKIAVASRYTAWRHQVSHGRTPGAMEKYLGGIAPVVSAGKNSHDARLDALGFSEVIVRGAVRRPGALGNGAHALSGRQKLFLGTRFR